AGAGEDCPLADLQVDLGHGPILTPAAEPDQAIAQARSPRLSFVAWTVIGADSHALTARRGALEHGLEGGELGDLGAHLPGDHRCHQAHEPSGLQTDRDPDAGALLWLSGQLEHARRTGRACGDNDLEPTRRIEDGDLVVAVDAPAARSGENLPVSR